MPTWVIADSYQVITNFEKIERHLMERGNGEAGLNGCPESEELDQIESEGILTHYKIEDLKIRHDREKAKGTLTPPESNWKKKSIFFELPYWKFNLIRHNLDLMHGEKNFCDNILWTILGTIRAMIRKSYANHSGKDLQAWNLLTRSLVSTKNGDSVTSI